MDELFDALEKQHQYLGESGELQRRRKARRREELLSRVEYEVRRRLTTKARTDSDFAHFLEEVSEGKIPSPCRLSTDSGKFGVAGESVRTRL